MSLSLVIKLFFLLFCSTLLADGKADFDEQTEEMGSTLPIFQTPEYQFYRDFFMAAKEQIAHDKKLTKKIARSRPSAKFNQTLPQYGVILKKRRHSNIREVWAWEVSQLLGSSAFVVPSYPMVIGDKTVVLQKLERFHHGREMRGHEARFIKKVALTCYWKAHIQAYLLGLADLVARNIGISPQGKIRFFDNELAFTYINVPEKNRRTFQSGFLCESLDWPQYREKLSKREAAHLSRFIQSFKQVEKNLRLYTAFRPFAVPEGLAYRLKRIRSFSIKEGATFRDLYGHLFPTLDPGLDKLNKLVRSILNKKVDHGSSLLFACRWFKHFELTEKEQKALQAWIDTYVSK